MNSAYVCYFASSARYDLARSIMVYQHSRVLPHDSFLGTFIRLGIDWPNEEADPVHDFLLSNAQF